MSERMQETLLRSHRRALTVELVFDGVVIQENLAQYVTAGTVTVRRGAVQRTVDLTLDNASGRLRSSGLLDRLAARRSHDLLVRCGVYIPGQANPELLGQGLFRITGAKPGSDQTVSVSGMDYGWVINRAKFEAPYSIAAGTNYSTAITNLLRARYPRLDAIDLPTTGSTTPLLLFDEQGEPWTAVQRMGDGLGWIIEPRLDSYTPGVRARQASNPGLETQPVWSLRADDGELSALTAAEEEQDVDGLYNVVIATGEASGDSAPPRAVAVDANPASDTYVSGPFGRVPSWYSSPLLTDTAMAKQAAHTVLTRRLGATRAPKVTSLPNPGLELGDVIDVQEPDTDIEGRFLIDQIRLPLTTSGGLMQLDLLSQIPVEVT